MMHSLPRSLPREQCTVITLQVLCLPPDPDAGGACRAIPRDQEAPTYSMIAPTAGRWSELRDGPSLGARQTYQKADVRG